VTLCADKTDAREIRTPSPGVHSPTKVGATGEFTRVSAAPRVRTELAVPEMNVQPLRVSGHSSLTLTGQHRLLLERWVRARTTPQRLALRSRIVLLAADGLSNTQVGRWLGTTRHTVVVWRRRFAKGGPAALLRDAPGRGRKPKLSPSDLADMLRTESGLSIRKLAKLLGVSPSSVHRAMAATRTRSQYRDSTDQA
jgi:transposase